jgi:hypothetical protein
MWRVLLGVCLISFQLSTSACSSREPPPEKTEKRALTAEEATFEARVQQVTAEASVGADRLFRIEQGDDLGVSWEEFAAKIDNINEKIEQLIITVEASNHRLDWREPLGNYLQSLQKLLSVSRRRWRAEITPPFACSYSCSLARGEFWVELKTFLAELSSVKPNLPGFRLVDGRVLTAALDRHEERVAAVRKADVAASPGNKPASNLSAPPRRSEAARAASEIARQNPQERDQTQQATINRWAVTGQSADDAQRPLGKEDAPAGPVVLEGVRRRPRAAEPQSNSTEAE